MTQSIIASSALAAILALGLVGTATAQDSGKEKCYGIAEAGKNDCANLAGTHSCAGQAKESKAAGEWKYVAKGTCKDMGGNNMADAKKQMDTMKK